jgi:hypothetical protein
VRTKERSSGMQREGGSKANKGRRIERWEEKGRDEGSGRDAEYTAESKRGGGVKVVRSQGAKWEHQRSGRIRERSS